MVENIKKNFVEKKKGRNKAMSDEERIEQLELENKVLQDNNKGLKTKIDEQSKEIEELKETLKCTQNSWYEDTIKIEEMKKQIDLDNECEIALNSKVMDLEKEIEKLKEKTKKCEYYEMVADELYKNSVSKDKIKAKIEEYKESGSVDGTNDILITEMQSLLEKE